MPSGNRRINLTFTDGLAHSLAVLGFTTDLDPSEVPAPGATQITGAMARYADAIGRANRELERTLTREEWNFLADVMNGCVDIWCGAPANAFLRDLLANAADGQALDGTGDKWLGNELEPGSGEKATKALLAKLRGLTVIHADAIMCAIRYFWLHCQDVDHVSDEWWTLEYRTGPPRRHRAGRETTRDSD